MTTLVPETIKTYWCVRISLVTGVALLFCALPATGDLCP